MRMAFPSQDYKTQSRMFSSSSSMVSFLQLTSLLRLERILLQEEGSVQLLSPKRFRHQPGPFPRLISSFPANTKAARIKPQVPAGAMPYMAECIHCAPLRVPEGGAGSAPPPRSPPRSPAQEGRRCPWAGKPRQHGASTRTATLGSKNEGVAGHPTIRDAPSELGFHSGHVREGNAFPRKRGEKVRTRLCPTPRPGPSGRGAGGGRGPGVPRSATECIPFYLFSVLRPGGV